MSKRIELTDKQLDYIAMLIREDKRDEDGIDVEQFKTKLINKLRGIK